MVILCPTYLQSTYIVCNDSMQLLKSSRNKKDLNDVTAAPFSVSFSQLPAAKKHRKRGSCDVIKVLLIL